MNYKELYDEYIELLNERTVNINKVEKLKKGYLSTKTISGKDYTYLQYRKEGKLLSDYVMSSNLSIIQSEVTERKQRVEAIKEINIRLEKIEAATKILDIVLYRKLTTIRKCIEMDSLSLNNRKAALSFGNSMHALEGVAATKNVDENLVNWANGGISFLESFLSTLHNYNIMEVIDARSILV